MDDKRLLELAALAADMDGQYSAYPGMEVRHGYEFALYVDGHGYWNPLTDDGDAFRLAVRLKMEIDHNHQMDDGDPWVSVWASPVQTCAVSEFEDEQQRAIATRRAIVRAAAAIGEGMP
jgi:hypothetical protein